MDKSRILLIGSGRCGNRIVDEMLELDGRYTGLYLNTTEVDLTGLKHSNRRSTFIVPNASGSGQNRKLAQSYVKEEQEKVADRILRYTQQDVVVCITSADGGSGSGITPLLMNVTRAMAEEKSINLVAVLPRYSKGRISFENTLEFWNEVMTLYKNGVINSIMLVDNNKRDTDEEVNEKLVEELDACLGAEGLVDESDSWVVNNDRGYKIVLNLEEGYDTIDDAIEACIHESVFVYPDECSKKCNSILGLINPEAYDIEGVKNQYSYKGFNKFGISEDYNTIILGGCKIPKQAIESYNKQLKRLQREDIEENNLEEDLMIDISSVKKSINNRKSPAMNSINVKPNINKRKTIKDKLKDKKIWEI